MKFHDQFFEQKGTKHDQLVAKVLEKIDDVATLLCRVKFPEPYIEKRFCCWYDGDVYAAVDTQSDSNFHTGNYHCAKFSTYYSEQCDKQGGGAKCTAESNVFNVDHPYTEHSRALKKETEHIFYGYNRFILGFADVILDVTDDFTALSGEAKISHERELSTLLIDCKPKLDDMGAVARQIKTYAAELKNKRTAEVVKVIITCDYPSHAARVIAQNEEIVLVHYDNAMSRFSLITDDAIEVAAL